MCMISSKSKVWLPSNLFVNFANVNISLVRIQTKHFSSSFDSFFDSTYIHI